MTSNTQKSLGFGKRRLIAEIIKNSWNVDDPYSKNLNLNDVFYIIQEMQEYEGMKYLEGGAQERGSLMVFKMFAQLLLHRNIANYDSMELMTSEKGTGKSSSALMLAREWMRLQGRKFDPAKSVAYNNTDLMEKIENSQKFDVIIADEAVRFASSADWAKAENKILKKKLAEVRTKHLLFILCFPLKINKIEKNYLESFTNYWCDLFGRGLGAIYVKDKNPSNDPWRIKDFKKVGSYTEFTNLKEVEKKLKKHPNFWNIIKFPKPPKWLYDKYLEIREDNVYNDSTVRSSVTTEDIHKALLLLSLQSVMMNDTHINMTRIALHIKNSYDIPIAKKNIQNILSDARKLVTAIRQEQVRKIGS